MAEWARGYVSDIGYTHDFYFDMTPSHICLAMLLAGVAAPDLTAPFTYCELGCGQGLTANILAAAHPHGQFWATDFNPAHAHNAARLARDAGSTNIRFFDHDFAAMLDADLPQFDVIALHGVYSWVSVEVQQTIVDFIAKCLKLGGVVYISYNALPGWAAAMPLRDLIVRHTTGTNSLTRVETGLALVRRLAALNARYFADQPAMRLWLEKMGTQSGSYLAHEYCTQDFHPRYFPDVAEEMARAKLSFAASAHIADNIDALNFSGDAIGLLRETAGVLAQEALRDILANKPFRRDLFVRGLLRLPMLVQAEALLKTRVALVVASPENLPMSARFPVGEVALQAEVYRPIIKALARGPACVGSLLSEPALAATGQAGVLQAIRMLCAMRHVMAALPEAGEDERKVNTDRFNAAVLERARYSNEVSYLASPVLGSGVVVDWIGQLFLLAGLLGQSPGAFALQVIEEQEQRPGDDREAPPAETDRMAEMQAVWEDFRTVRLPVLRQLRVI